MPTALITGATAGIGAAFARRLAAGGYDLVLVARNEQRLAELAAKLNTACEVLPADLTTDEGIAAVETRCRKGVDVLVNNAGFGHRDHFLEVPVDREVAMLRLHTEAVLRATLSALPGMIERGRGGVINVASIAAFLPNGTYAATKSWVVTFSHTTHAEVAAKGVNVMALCPGFTRTEFHQRARMNMSALPGFMWLKADRVVAAALRDLRKGKAMSIPGLHYKVIIKLGGIIPATVVSRAGVTLSRRRLPPAKPEE